MLELSAETTSALVGAAVGGLISLFLQVAVVSIDRRKQRREETELYRRKMVSLYFDIGKTVEFVDRLQEIATDGIAKVSSGAVTHLCLGMGVIYTNVEPRSITDEELYFLIRARKDNDISSIHRFLDNARILLKLVEEYRDKREALLIALPGTASGGAVTLSPMSEEEIAKYEPRIVYLDMLARMISDNLERTANYGKSAESALKNVLSESLGINIEGEHP